ncbi:hypothetical protein N9H60_03950, partial [Flavimaricola sp.]
THQSQHRTIEFRNKTAACQKQPKNHKLQDVVVRTNGCKFSVASRPQGIRHLSQAIVLDAKKYSYLLIRTLGNHYVLSCIE